MDYLSILKKRHSQLRALLSKTGANSFFCTSFSNIYYLSGFAGLSPEERESTLLVTQTQVILYVPKMYQEQAKALQSVKSGIITLKVDIERDGLMHMFRKDVKKGESVLVESTNLTLEEFYRISDNAEFQLQGYAGLVEELRVRKDIHEKKILDDVVSRTDTVFEDVVAFLRTTDYTTLTELDLADKLMYFGRQHGLREFSFDPIVAVGPGSSEPHYKTGFRKLERGNVLLMDFGFKLNGYCSDLTRTVFLGRATPEQKKMYSIVLEGNWNALRNCKVGVNAGQLHKEAVAFFEKNKLGKYFIHGLGHGVGLDVHEEPYFRPARESELQEGMVVTIEPGLYFPGKYGIRIEDYVIMGKKDGEVLSNCTKELIEIE